MSRVIMAAGKKTICFQFVPILKKNSGFKLLEEAKHTTLLFSPLLFYQKAALNTRKNTFTWETVHEKHNTLLQSPISWILLC